MMKFRIGAALAALAAAPVSALGAEGGGWNPLQGDFGNFVWTVVVLLIVFWLLSKYAWGPLLAGLQGREQFIRESLEQAKGDRDQAAARLAEYEAKLATARREVEAMIEEARRDAAALRLREEQRAKEEAEARLARARREIDIAKDTAVKELYSQAAHLATAAAAKILEREIDPKDHERLIAESIDSLQRMETN